MEGIMSANKQVIVIDDDDMVTTLIKRFLTEAGFDAIAFKDASIAYKYLIKQDGQIDLIISDILMSNIEGFEFLQLLDKNYPDIPVLMMSSDSDYLAMTQSLGANDSISKPIERDVLLSKVTRLLA